MSYSTQEHEVKSDNASGEEKKQSLFGVIVHSFFVIPFLLIVFSVLLFLAVRILTMENRTAYDYLEDVKIGGLTKRWQGAFELSKILANPKLIPQDIRFENEMVEAFRKSEHDDDRVRQYLALAMARTGNKNFVPVLLEKLATEKVENLHAIIYSLGILKSNQTQNVLLNYLDNNEARIRWVTVMALGNIGDRNMIEPIKKMLYDPEPNVQWEAAVALAKLNDASGEGVLLKLMDRQYLEQFAQVDDHEKNRVMITSIEAASILNDPKLKETYQKIFETDKNMNVRKVAYDALQKIGTN